MVWFSLNITSLDGPWSSGWYFMEGWLLGTDFWFGGLYLIPVVLRGVCDESHDHLFFSCPYSAAVWTQLLLKCGIARTLLLFKEEIFWSVNFCRKKSVGCTVFKLLVAAAIYHLQGEWTYRIFRQKGVAWQEVCKQVIDNVRACLCGWRKVEPSVANHDFWRHGKFLVLFWKLYSLFLLSFL